MKVKRIEWSIITVCILLAAGLISFEAHKAGLSTSDIRHLRPLIILSGSMEPNYRVGSAVVLKQTHEAEAQELSKGEVITFKNPEKSGKLVTHRIDDVKRDNGKTTYITKGDANEEPDSWEISPDLVIGQAMMPIPYLGHVMMYASTRNGYLILILLPALLIIFGEIRKIIGYIRKEEKNDSGKDKAKRERPKWRRYKARHTITKTRSYKTPVKISIVLALVVLGAALALVLTSKVTLATFFDKEVSKNNIFTAAVFDDVMLQIKPGEAKALRHNSCGELKYIFVATEKNGSLSLDFGELEVGSHACFADVLRLKNKGDEDIIVIVEAEGEIKPLIDKIIFQESDMSGSYLLRKNKSAKVNFKTKISSNQQHGTYHGFVTVKSNEDILYAKIPTIINFFDPQHQHHVLKTKTEVDVPVSDSGDKNSNDETDAQSKKENADDEELDGKPASESKLVDFESEKSENVLQVDKTEEPKMLNDMNLPELDSEIVEPLIDDTEEEAIGNVDSRFERIDE